MTPGQEQQAEAPQQTPEQKQFADNLKQVEAAVKAPEQAEQIKKLLDRNFQEWLKNLANTSEGQNHIKDIYTQIDSILIPNSESSTRLHDANEAVLKNLQILIAPFTMESKFANVNVAVDASTIKTDGSIKETYNESTGRWLLRASISKLGSNVYQNLPARDTILTALQNPTKENIQSLQIFLASNLKNGKDKDDFLKWNNKKRQFDTRDGKYGKLTDGALNAYIDQSKTQMEANAVTKNTAEESIAELQKITKERPIPQMAAVAAPALRKTVSPAEQQQKQIDNLKILQKSELFAKLPNKLHNKIDSVLKKDDGQQDGEYSVNINDRINDITALIDEEIAEKKKAREGYLPEGEFQKYGNDITALIAAKSGTINQKDTAATVIDTPVATFSQEPDAVKSTESAPIDQNLNFYVHEEVKPTPQQTETTPITLITKNSKVDAGKVVVDKANTKVDKANTTPTTGADKIKSAEIINTTLNKNITLSMNYLTWLTQYPISTRKQKDIKNAAVRINKIPDTQADAKTVYGDIIKNLSNKLNNYTVLKDIFNTQIQTSLPNFDNRINNYVEKFIENFDTTDDLTTSLRAFNSPDKAQTLFSLLSLSDTDNNKLWTGFTLNKATLQVLLTYIDTKKIDTWLDVFHIVQNGKMFEVDGSTSFDKVDYKFSSLKDFFTSSKLQYS